VAAAEALTWDAAQWSDRCAAHLMPLFSKAEICKFQRLTGSGEWLLLAAVSGGQEVAHMVLSIQRGDCGPELHCHAISGALRGVVLLDSATGVLRALAQAFGCEKITCFTDRRGLVRKIEKLGGRARFVCEWEV
jgi:hypothetical protein